VARIAAIVSAFVKDGEGGNRAGVVLDADGIPDAERQRVAAELGLSETVFVEPVGAGFKLRYFTPTTELDLCGHATIAAFGLLRERALIGPGAHRFDTKAGALSADVGEDGLVMMTQNLPFFGAPAELEEVSRALGGIRVRHARLVSTGLPDLLAKVDSRDALETLAPDFDAIRLLTTRAGAMSIHVFAPGEGAVSAYCRDFAPAVGIDEDPATGTASGALACHLIELGDPAREFAFVQGPAFESLIRARVETRDGKIERVQVGGRARFERDRAIS